MIGYITCIDFRQFIIFQYTLPLGTLLRLLWWFSTIKSLINLYTIVNVNYYVFKEHKVSMYVFSTTLIVDHFLHMHMAIQ